MKFDRPRDAVNAIMRALDAYQHGPTGALLLGIVDLLEENDDLAHSVHFGDWYGRRLDIVLRSAARDKVPQALDRATTLRLRLIAGRTPDGGNAEAGAR